MMGKARRDPQKWGKKGRIARIERGLEEISTITYAFVFHSEVYHWREKELTKKQRSLRRGQITWTSLTLSLSSIPPAHSSPLKLSLLNLFDCSATPLTTDTSSLYLSLRGGFFTCHLLFPTFFLSFLRSCLSTKPRATNSLPTLILLISSAKYNIINHNSPQSVASTLNTYYTPHSKCPEVLIPYLMQKKNDANLLKERLFWTRGQQTSQDDTTWLILTQS